MACNNSLLDLPTLKAWIWDAACVIRGPQGAPKIKDYILPLIFLKRLSNFFDDEVKRLWQELGDPEGAARLGDEGHKLVWLYLHEMACWPAIWHQTTGVGEYFTSVIQAMARENSKFQDVIDVAEFNAPT